MSRLAQMRLAAFHTWKSTYWTSGPYFGTSHCLTKIGGEPKVR